MAILDGEVFHAEKFSCVYFRGDGLNKVVNIPSGYVATSITPFQAATQQTLPNGGAAVVWNEPPGAGKLMRIMIEPFEQGG